MTPCNCRVSTHRATPTGSVECEAHIAHCPLHKAAGEMLVIVKEHYAILKQTGKFDERCEDLLELIAKAEEK